MMSIFAKSKADIKTQTRSAIDQILASNPDKNAPQNLNAVYALAATADSAGAWANLNEGKRALDRALKKHGLDDDVKSKGGYEAMFRSTFGTLETIFADTTYNAIQKYKDKDFASATELTNAIVADIEKTLKANNTVTDTIDFAKTFALENGTPSSKLNKYTVDFVIDNPNGIRSQIEAAVKATPKSEYIAAPAPTPAATPKKPDAAPKDAASTPPAKPAASASTSSAAAKPAAKPASQPQTETQQEDKAQPASAAVPAAASAASVQSEDKPAPAAATASAATPVAPQTIANPASTATGLTPEQLAHFSDPLVLLEENPAILKGLAGVLENASPQQLAGLATTIEPILQSTIMTKLKLSEEVYHEKYREGVTTAASIMAQTMGGFIQQHKDELHNNPDAQTIETLSLAMAQKVRGALEANKDRLGAFATLDGNFFGSMMAKIGLVSPINSLAGVEGKSSDLHVMDPDGLSVYTLGQSLLHAAYAPDAVREQFIAEQHSRRSFEKQQDGKITPEQISEHVAAMNLGSLQEVHMMEKLLSRTLIEGDVGSQSFIDEQESGMSKFGMWWRNSPIQGFMSMIGNFFMALMDVFTGKVEGDNFLDKLQNGMSIRRSQSNMKGLLDTLKQSGPEDLGYYRADAIIAISTTRGLMKDTQQDYERALRTGENVEMARMAVQDAQEDWRTLQQQINRDYAATPEQIFAEWDAYKDGVIDKAMNAGADMVQGREPGGTLNGQSRPERPDYWTPPSQRTAQIAMNPSLPSQIPPTRPDILLDADRATSGISNDNLPQHQQGQNGRLPSAPTGLPPLRHEPNGHVPALY